MTCIQTERLIIKYGEIEDYVKIHEFDFNYLQNIDGIFKYVKRDPDEVRSWFANYNSMEERQKKSEANNSYYFIIYKKDTNEPIGDIGFDRYHEDLNCLEVSCWFHPNFWGKGYAREALISLMDYIYSQGYDNIIFGYYDNNEKSKKLCNKMQFEPYMEKEVGNYFGTKSIEYQHIMSREKFKDLYGRSNKL